MAAQKWDPPEPHTRPFLKWAGGKRQLLGQYEKLFPPLPPKSRYLEPFVGSGAVYFHLYNQGKLHPSKVSLWDLNKSLIAAWNWVRDDPAAIIAELRRLSLAYEPDNPETYYANRERYNALGDESSAEKAALLICLNRTCFNGLFRVNSRGAFNVPVGRYRKPKILDEANLWSVSRSLEEATLESRHYSDILHFTRNGDFVYFDPPYFPLSPTSAFSNYSSIGFSEDDHWQLAEVFEELTRRKVRCMLSNSSAPLVLELYGAIADRRKRVHVHRVHARRSINARGSGRASVEEIVVTNY